MVFDVTILGSGSATPTLNRGTSSQAINVLERHFLFDCGEGTQVQLRRYKVKFQRINHIFISHLHGDHYLGLVGYISSLHLLGRKNPIHIYGPEPLEEIVRLQLKAGHSHLNFELIFHPLTSKESELIFEDKLVEVYTIPLNHRIYCNGFLVKEKAKERKINKDVLDQVDIPLAFFKELKAGKDFVDEKGVTHSNASLTMDPPAPRSYAYVTDTKIVEKNVDLLKGVNLLYHEATFLEQHAARAKATFHTTALQAAQYAKKCEVGQLVLGHFSARYKGTEELVAEAKTVFENTQAVEDGDKYSVL